MPDGTPAAFSAFSLVPPDDALIDEGTERALLGALMTKPAALSSLPAAFSAAAFAIEIHGEIFQAIAARAGADHPIASDIMKAIALDDLERRAAVAAMVAETLGTHPALIRDLGASLLDLWRRRRLAALGRHIAAAATRPADAHPVDATVAEAMLTLDELTTGTPSARRGVTVLQAVDEAIAAAERAAHGEDQGIRTGFASLDAALGPLERGALYVLGARTAMGKSSLALQIGMNAARQGLATGYISLEMQSRQLGARALAVAAGVPLGLIRSGRYGSAAAEQIVRARHEFAEMPLIIEDEGGLSAIRIAMKARSIARRQGLQLLIVDHLHIVAPDRDDSRLGATWAVGKVSNALKALAKDLDVPVLALAQLNRQVEGRDDHRPTMADLRQSGEIEQDAEAVMLLHRAEHYLSKSPPEQLESERDDKFQDRLGAWQAARERTAGKAELIMPKVRDGEPGAVQLHWNGPLTRFEESED